ncbi:MAG: aminotransferase class I/II-fold pyridoxal phosphate-dependent enzyme [Bacteroidetes bacterium]|nr:aminotransferase class I/II-fold pyridoxal phosphate-dependent enzyme [Bacteroidota bacterium]MDA1121523.1 aminotransferase class I/II-fold pyridoxal phosphate-dependent enzyme [Bacteroidota bacterium]
MDGNEFRKQAHHLIDWIADYIEQIEWYPVKSQVNPGEILKALPDIPPEAPEAFEAIFKDFEKIIVPGISHWQSPKFHAYFPANSSYPSVLGEMLTAALGAQCMMWETSPAATELEEKVLGWLKMSMGIPVGFSGVIQDTASTATLCALITAREKSTEYAINEEGFNSRSFRVYCSTETHASIEKAVRISGIGKSNLVKTKVDSHLRLDVEALEKAINEDIGNGLIPLCIVATLGTTGTCAIDPLKKIADVSSKYGIWLHVDAAFAGTALLLDEYQWMAEGIELADSFVFNPHKWMLTNFDCSAYFVKDKEALVKTFELIPEYLKSQTAVKVNNYKDWGIQLGRRFRALKLWFVIRSFGLEGIRKKLREHIELATQFEFWVEKSKDFELMIPRSLSIVCFRYNPLSSGSTRDLNRLNQQLLENLNLSGQIYLSHTTVNDNYCIRMVIGQTNIEAGHIRESWELILETTKYL